MCSSLLPRLHDEEQEAPALAGPSEFGTSITISVTPDVIDAGRRVAERGHGHGARRQRPAAAQRAAARRDSRRRRADGLRQRSRRATSSPAPTAAPRSSTPRPAPSRGRGRHGTVVDIGVTPVGTDFANAVTLGSPRCGWCRPGIVVPPSDLHASRSRRTAHDRAGGRPCCSTPRRAPRRRAIRSSAIPGTSATARRGIRCRTASHTYLRGGTPSCVSVVAETRSAAPATASQDDCDRSVAPAPTADFVVSPSDPRAEPASSASTPRRPTAAPAARSSATPGTSATARPAPGLTAQAVVQPRSAPTT